MQMNKKNFWVLVTVSVTIAVTFTVLGFFSGNSCEQQRLGAITWNEMEQIWGGGESSGCDYDTCGLNGIPGFQPGYCPCSSSTINTQTNKYTNGVFTYLTFPSNKRHPPDPNLRYEEVCWEEVYCNYVSGIIGQCKADGGCDNTKQGHCGVFLDGGPVPGGMFDKRTRSYADGCSDP